MMNPTWQLDPEVDETPAGSAQALVSLKFLLAALRRRWKTWVGLALVGLMLGAAWTVVFPAKSTATVTLMLAHDPNTNPDQAMSTDISLLRTRTVAEAVIDELGLEMTPEAFQKAVTASSASSNVLIIEVPAPNGAAAVARAKALSENYLEFRTEQVKSQSNALIDGYEKRIAALQKDADRLTTQYSVLSSDGSPVARSQAADVLAERSQVHSEINTVQQIVQDTGLKANSIVAASQVIDPARIVPVSDVMRLALAMASGLVGGTAVGMGLVLFVAITSDRLRRREEVALALGAPVRFSVRGLRQAPRERQIRKGSPAAHDLQVLVHGLNTAISPRQKTGSRKGRVARLAVAAVDNVEVAEIVAASTAAELAQRHHAVFLVDLSQSGHLEAALAKALRRGKHELAPDDVPVVFRPEGVPSLAKGPLGAGATVTVDLPSSDPRRPAWDAADVVLTLAEVDPAVGVEHLSTWTKQLVVLVTAGRSSAERLRTTAELTRSAGLHMLFAMMTGADDADESLGTPESQDPGWPAVRRTP